MLRTLLLCEPIQRYLRLIFSSDTLHTAIGNLNSDTKSVTTLPSCGPGTWLQPWQHDASSKETTVLHLNGLILVMQGTNTYLVGTGSSRLLVDSGEGGKEEWREGLQGVLQVLVHVVKHSL